MISSRRAVIKTLFLGAAFSNVIGRGWSHPVLVALQSAPSNQDGFLRLDLADFPDLAKARGSVRISTSTLDPATHKQTGLFPPVIINRDDSSRLHVLSAACTHEDCIVPRIDKSSNLMTCPCHGSQYHPDGSVARGPAQQSLQTFDFNLDGQVLTIRLPEVFYEMTVDKAPSDPKLKITFIAFSNITYELYFRGALETAAAQVKFSSTPTGAADQADIAGIDDYLSLYVDRPGKFGFYEVVMKTQAV